MSIRSIEATIEVEPDGTSHLTLAEPLAPGRHDALLLLDDAGSTQPLLPTLLDMPPLQAGPFPAGLTFSREQLYSSDEEFREMLELPDDA